MFDTVDEYEDCPSCHFIDRFKEDSNQHFKDNIIEDFGDYEDNTEDFGDYKDNIEDFGDYEESTEDFGLAKDSIEDFDEVVLDNTVRYHPDIDYLKYYEKSNKNYMADSKQKVEGENFVQNRGVYSSVFPPPMRGE